MRYALRKHHQKWAICIDRSVAMELDDFNEAFVIAWNAASALQASERTPQGRPNEDLALMASETQESDTS
jgi:hypothetical protein